MTTLLGSEIYVYGLHPVTALITSALRSVIKLYISDDRRDKKIKILEQLAISKNIVIERRSNKVMQQDFAQYNHQGVVAITTPLPSFVEADLKFILSQLTKPSLILVLDGITDPHNLGACIRTADAAGVDFVIIPKDKNATVNTVVSRVACGAVEFLPIVQVTNLVRTIELLQQCGVWIFGAANEAEQSVYQLDCSASLAIVLGGEGNGLRRLTRERCDGLFSIPMLGAVESLNVSVATGVTLYEIVRQRFMLNRQ